MENDEMTNDAAVAWLVTNGGESCEPWLVWELSEVKALPSSCIADPLYSATTVAELRAQIAAYRAADESMQEELGRQVSLRMAAERRVAELLQAVREVQIAESDVRIHEAMNPRSRNYRLPIYEAQRQARERLSALAKETP